MKNQRVAKVVLVCIPTILLIVFATIAATRFLSGAQGDWATFYFAAAAVADGSDIYASHIGGYIYPPLLAVALQPLVPLGLEAGGAVWTVAMAALVALGAWFASREIAARLYDGDRPPAAAETILCIGSLVVAEKVLAVLKLGQTDPIILACLGGAMALAARRPVAAGLALAVAVSIKYHAILFLPYLVLRRRWLAAAAFLAGIPALLLAPAAAVGWERNLDYLAVAFAGFPQMLGLAEAAEAAARIPSLWWERSVSLPSAMARLSQWLGGGTAATLGLSAGLALVALLAWIAPVAAAGVPVLRGRTRETDDAGPWRDIACIEWISLVAVLLIFSIQTTARHMMLGMLPAMLAAAVLAGRWGTRDAWLPLIGLVAFGLALVLPPTDWGGALAAWRAVGGASWAMLAMLLLALAAWARGRRPAGAPRAGLAG